MALLIDEWTAFMHAFDDELVGGLTTFYDVVVPYEHHRRGKDIRIRIPSPQLTILGGSTPSNLIKFMPEGAWDQGFTSRLILIYSDERRIGDDFAQSSRALPESMLHDLKLIYSLFGEFTVTEGYRKAVAEWRSGGEEPKPSHPKLLHYNTRRRAHVYKLSMIASVDRSSALALLEEDFFTALAWLREAELNMPAIFEEGATSVDARAMDEIVDFIRRQGTPVQQFRIVHFASTLIPAHSVMKVLEIMSLSGRIHRSGEDKFGGLYSTTYSRD